MLWVIIMVEGIFIILTLLFCVFGVVFFIQQLALLIASPAISNRAYLVFLSGEAADVELELAINTLSWQNVQFISLQFLSRSSLLRHLHRHSCPCHSCRRRHCRNNLLRKRSLPPEQAQTPARRLRVCRSLR